VLLALFVALLALAAHPAASPRGVDLFFRLDPLAALLSTLASHRFAVALLPSLAVVALSLLLGRAAVCGWGLCPLGTLNHLASWLFRARSASVRRARNAASKTQRIKLLVLAACLGCAILGSAAGGWLDPIGLAARGVGLFVLPAAGLVVDPAGQHEAIEAGGALDAVEGALEAGAGAVTGFAPRRFQAGWLVGATLVVILALNAFRPRFWCRVLCPLGALLGLLSRFAALGMSKRDDACDGCDRCRDDCQGADEPRGRETWREGECVLCLNCQAACPHDVLSFSLFPRRAAPSERAEGPNRRAVIGAAVAGAALVPLSRVSPGFDTARSPGCIRPPGSRDEPDFLARCTRCGLCMAACPTNAIHPALAEAGLEGVLTPVLVMRVGYCEPSCVACGQACPTGAIRPLTEAEKTGDGGHGGPVRLGTAFVERGRCLPWAMSTPCIVCEEFCPAQPKAITLERVVVEGEGGHTIELARPVVAPERCTGCGACEHVCPVEAPPAIAVSHVGESRDSSPSFLLRRR
jgi:ferredoxin